MLAFIALVGIIGNSLVESVDAWHVEFPSKKECMDSVIEVTGDNTESKRVCERLIPHD